MQGGRDGQNGRFAASATTGSRNHGSPSQVSYASQSFGLPTQPCPALPCSNTRRQEKRLLLPPLGFCCPR